MKAHFHKRLAKDLSRLDAKIEFAFENRIELFIINPYDIRLNNHPLKGKWSGYRSINISGDIRALYKEIADEEVVFTNIGSHNYLYG